MSLKGKVFSSKLLIFTLAFLIAFGQFAYMGPAYQAEAASDDVVLLITGTGVKEEVRVHPSDWDKYDMVERYYSSNNSKDFHKITKVKGYDVFDLIGDDNLKTDEDYKVTFFCSDGVEIEKNISALKSVYTYQDFTEENKEYVRPILSLYKRELIEVLGKDLNPPLQWEDQELTEEYKDDKAPRLVFGQENMDEMNQSNWGWNIIKIQVGEERPQENPDISDSPYKHIHYNGAPYNVDSITGATLTIEGPGVESYRAISVRQIEESNDGLIRGTYAENIKGEVKQNTYEGISVAYLLDHFVKLKDNAGKIILKDKSRQKIEEYTLDEIRRIDYRNNTTGENNLQMMIAYGINEVPLVFTNTDVGYITEKYNDNGCLKFAVGQKTETDVAKTFSNVAYIYVEEEDAPGIYEHTQPPYNDPQYTNYLLTLTGSGLEKEKNYSVSDIETMKDKENNPLQIEKEYSLSNSEYFWYYNTYKGVKLWDLLLDAGMDPNIDENTKVQMVAADNYNFQPMTIKDIKDDALYGYYEKDSNDLGDGKFDGSTVEPLEKGYPVLVAYGFNGYPYVTHPNDAGYNAGLGNDGGPLRVIFGKKSYDHTNGSHQVQFAKKIIIGEDKNYTIHNYDPYDTFANSPLTVEVKGDDGSIIKQENLTVSSIEDMIYGEAVSAATRDEAKVKASYFTKVYKDQKISDLYEGIGLWYLLSEKIGLPSTTGNVVFTDEEGNTKTFPLEDIKKSDYFNEVTGDQNVKPILAYAKKGYPLVKDKTDIGYVAKNNGGPLMIIFAQTQSDIPGEALSNIQKITVTVQKDSWSHMDSPYDAYKNDTLVIHGEGARKEKTLTLSELESLQNYIMTNKYCLAKSADKKYEDMYRGIDFYEYLRKEIGFQASATNIKLIASDGYEKTFSINEIAKNDYVNELSNTHDLKVMLAYGKNEKPLVPDGESEGYDSTAKNKGGPLQFIIGQTEAGDLNSSKCISNIKEIVIEGVEGDSWKHDHGLYTDYEDQPVLRVTGSQIKEPKTFTLKELEDLNEQIVRSTYTGDGIAEFEGVILWDLIKDVVGLKDGIDNPNIRIFSGQGYNQILQNMDQVKNGVKNSQGEIKDIILSYAKDGYPLVPTADSAGYDNNNQFGPVRLIIEENKSMWIKSTDCIVVGYGDYEDPKETMEDAVLTVEGSGVDKTCYFTLDQFKNETEGRVAQKYYAINNFGTKEHYDFEGISLPYILDHLVGMKSDIESVTIEASDGYKRIYNLSDTRKDYIDETNPDAKFPMILAWNENGDDLTGENPLKFVIGQTEAGDVNKSNWVRNVAKIIVKEKEQNTGKVDTFTVFGDHIQQKEYTIEQLKGFGESTEDYAYSSKGEMVTDTCKGILLSKVLENLGITKENTQFKLTTTDGYDYGTVTLKEIKEQKYLVTYEANGESFEDADKNGVPSSIRIYRNFDDGSSWKNKCRNISGIKIPVWNLYKNDDESGLSLASIRCITPYDRGIWVGTYGGGLAHKDNQDQWTVYNTVYSTVYDTVYGQVYNDDSSFKIDTVYDVKVDKEDGAWITVGGAESGQGVVYKKGDKWTVYNTANSELPADFVQSIALDHKGGVWFGTAKGAAYKDQDGNWTIYNKDDGFQADSVTKIEVDDQGGVWFGFYPETIGENKYIGGYAYLDSSGRITTYTDPSDTSFQGNWVRSISIDKDGGVWICCSGSYEGKDAKIHYIKNGQRTVYDVTDIYPSIGDGDDIRLVAADQYGGLWLGTRSSGVIYRNTKGQITEKYNSTNEWPSPKWDNVYYLDTDDKGNIWAGTNGGVALATFVRNNDGDSDNTPDVKPVDADLTIKGPGVNKPYYFTLDQLKDESSGRVSKSYFSINKAGTREYFDFEGISLAYLLDHLVSMNSSAKSVRIIANDYSCPYNLEEVRMDYMDENNPRAKLPMILAWEENGSMLDDDHPLKLVMGQTREGEINKKFWVHNIVEIIVSDEKVDPEDRPSGNYDPDENTNIDLSDHMKSEMIKAKNGRNVERITLDEKAKDTLKNAKEGSELKFSGKENNEGLQVELSGEILQQANSKKLNIKIENGRANYYLPTDILPINEIAKELGVDLEELQMNITVSKISEEQESELKNSLKNGQEMLSDLVEFKIEFKAKDKSLEFSHFGNHYVQREMLLNNEVDPSRATGVVWNEEKKGFDFVPTRFETRDGKTYGVVLNRTNSVYTVLQTSKTFDDIKDHWAKDAIECLASKMIISGKDEKNFAPRDSITRAEFTVLLARALALPQKTVDKDQFKDIHGDEWFAESVAAAVDEGIMTGYEDGTFRPNNKITRQEMAVMLSNALKIAGKEEKMDQEEINRLLEKYNDNKEIASWAREGVAMAVKAEMINGMGNNIFSPKTYADRAQSATMLKNFLIYVGFINE